MFHCAKIEHFWEFIENENIKKSIYGFLWVPEFTQFWELSLGSEKSLTLHLKKFAKSTKSAHPIAYCIAFLFAYPRLFVWRNPNLIVKEDY